MVRLPIGGLRTFALIVRVHIPAARSQGGNTSLGRGGCRYESLLEIITLLGVSLALK